LDAHDVIHLATMILTGSAFRYEFKKFKSGDGALQIFDDISCFPTLVRLMSGDGTASHCITIAGLWVFDSNKAEAEPLSHDFLDWCCSTDTIKDTFLAAHYAVRFFRKNPRKEWNLCQNCRKGEKCMYKFRPASHTDAVLEDFKTLNLITNEKGTLEKKRKRRKDSNKTDKKIK
jgi:hypothetical protein